MRTICRTAIIGLCVFVGGHAFAAVPTQLSVQGVLRDGTGKLQSMSLMVTVKLFDDKATGNLLASFGPTPVIAANGLFTEAITLTPMELAAVSKASAVWLEVTAGSDTLPRQLVTSELYAMMASAADSLSAACSGCVADAMIGGISAGKVMGKVAAAANADSAAMAPGYQKALLTPDCGAGKIIQAIAADGTVTCVLQMIGGGGISAVTASAPLASSGGATPNLSLGVVPVANGGTGSANGLNGANIQAGTVPASAIVTGALAHSHVPVMLYGQGANNQSIGGAGGGANFAEGCAACPNGTLVVSGQCQGNGTLLVLNKAFAFSPMNKWCCDFYNPDAAANSFYYAANCLSIGQTSIP